jgi:hypothetical protein
MMFYLFNFIDTFFFKKGSVLGKISKDASVVIINQNYIIKKFRKFASLETVLGKSRNRFFPFDFF